LIGGEDPNQIAFDKVSLAKHASDLSAPTLIIQPRAGGNESMDEVIRLVNGMKFAGKPVELMPLDSVEADALEARRLKQLQAMVTFMEKNNPAQ
jgi:dipeptidyl aminopeptidase/acylaminoacyl peptidase